jgi:hypothetical protein
MRRIVLAIGGSAVLAPVVADIRRRSTGAAPAKPLLLSSRQGAPVLSTHSIPSTTSLASSHGLLRSSARLLGSGRSDSSVAHCSSVRSMASLLHLEKRGLYLG